MAVTGTAMLQTAWPPGAERSVIVYGRWTLAQSGRFPSSLPIGNLLFQASILL